MRNLKRASAPASLPSWSGPDGRAPARAMDVTLEENQGQRSLQLSGVMVGDDEANLNPDKNVTRK